MKPRATISVIIPTLQSSQALETLIRQLNNPLILEIIVVSPFQPLSLPFENTLCLSSSVGRGLQIQTGLQNVTGDVIWILHADSRIPTHAPYELINILADQSVSLGAFQLAFEGKSFWLKLFAMLSRFDSSLTTFGDQGYFFRLSALNSLPDLVSFPLLEDVVIRKSLSKLGKVRKSKLAIITSAARFERYGPIRTQIKNIIILWQFWRGANPVELYKEYYTQT